MSSAIISNLNRLLEAGRDDALLRFSLGNEYLKDGDAHTAVVHFRRAIVHDPAYSAAWKNLGRALEASGNGKEALAAYRNGVAVAEQRGDKQAAKEMAVFARRLEKRAD